MKVDMSLFQKIVMVSSLGVVSIFALLLSFKKNIASNSPPDSIALKQQLLKQNHVRMLYSTMSFFYLVPFKPKDYQSFEAIRNVLQINKPNLIVLPLSKQEYQKKYIKVLRHPKFQKAITQFEKALKKSDKEQVMSQKDFNLQNLQKLYLINYCLKNKCKIIYAQKPHQLYQQYQRQYQQQLKPLNQLKADDYVNFIMEEMKPKKIKIFPQSPYKIILGLCDPQLLEIISKQWKQKFKNIYGHAILQDESIIIREKQTKQAKQNPHKIK